jgi:hypothetical protein
MKMILDLEHVIRELGLSQESYAQWKAANLDNVSAGGSGSWSALEDSGFLNKAFHRDLKIG